MRELGDIDILVNNAIGEFQPRPATDVTWEDFLEELEVSVKGMHSCCRQVIAGMRVRNQGKIINIGSAITDAPAPSQAKYITIKSAIVGYTRSLAVELAPDGIQVNLVSPQMVETSLIATLPPTLVKKLGEETAAGRLLQPIEVAQAILFLASSWSNAMSGERLLLNQGQAPFL